MRQEEFITIGTDQVICADVRILDVTSVSITIEDIEGRKLELDMDAITSIN